MNANDVITMLKLEPLPEEGGFYRETHRAPQTIEGRSISTCILFLQTPQEFSAFHLLKSSDEIWHFSAGDPIDLVLIDNDSGQAQHITLGSNLAKGQVPQWIVPAGTWFASRLQDDGAWGLVGCTVTPGFTFDDFVIGNREKLLARYPKAEAEIRALTRG